MMLFGRGAYDVHLMLTAGTPCMHCGASWQGKGRQGGLGHIKLRAIP